GVAGRARRGEPVDLLQRQLVSEQVAPRPDHDGTRLRLDRDDVHRLGEPAGKAAALPDGVAREAGVLAHHVAAYGHERAGVEGRGVAGQVPLAQTRIV